MMLLVTTTIPTFGMINEYESVKISTVLDNKYASDEFVVKFKENPISIISLNTFNKKHQVTSMEKLFENSENTILNNIYVLYISYASDILSIVEEYNSLSFVEYAEPNYIAKMDFIPNEKSKYIDQNKNEFSSLLIPNDPYFSLQYYLDNTGQVNGTPDADIDAPEAWEISTGSEDVVIGFVDGGIDYTHPDLVDNFWTNEDEIPDNGIDDDNNGYIDDVIGWDVESNDNDPIDESGHGTLCAGIAARGNNNIGISGICWNCKLMNVKMADEQAMVYATDAARGMRYAADNGADIIITNIAFPNNPRTLEYAVDYSYDLGPVLIAPAGNNFDNQEYSPAALDKVIGVAATDQNDSKAIFTNFGHWVDVAAAGWQTYSTMATYDVYYSEEYNLSLNYEYCGGTSFANPIVVGIAALLLSNDPALTNDEVMRIIRANVDPYNSEDYIGTGRVNAYKALTRYNTQPEIPVTPNGNTNGRPGREYTFTTSATDKDGDELWYFWDWDDGNYSEWIGPFGSGEESEASYTWEQEANFSIKVKVKDGKGGESYWSEEFIFSTPKNKIIDNVLFERLFNRFPILKLLI